MVVLLVWSIELNNWRTLTHICVSESLTHWARKTHICVSKVTIIVSDHGLSPGRRQAIIWNNAGILLIGPLGTNFSGILIEIHTILFRKMHLKMSSGNWRPFCLGLNVLIQVMAPRDCGLCICRVYSLWWSGKYVPDIIEEIYDEWSITSSEHITSAIDYVCVRGFANKY